MGKISDLLEQQLNRNSHNNLNMLFSQKYQELIAYVDEVESMPLIEMLKDPLSVGSPDDYVEAYLEQERLKRVKRVLNYINRQSAINEGFRIPIDQPDPEEIKTRFIPDQEPLEESKNFLFSLREAPDPVINSKEKALHDFKDHFKYINSIPKHSIQDPVFTRSLTTSSSHVNLIKKLERAESTPRELHNNRITNEITSTTTFRNGVLRPSSNQDLLSPNTLSSPNQQTTGASRSQLNTPGTGSRSYKQIQADYLNELDKSSPSSLHKKYRKGGSEPKQNDGEDSLF